MIYKNLIITMFYLLAVLVAASCQSGSTKVPASKVGELSTSEKNVFLDVRTPGEYNSGHIRNAVNIDVMGNSFTTEIKNLDPDKNYYVYCRSGRRAVQASQILQQNGFKNVFLLEGGMVNYPSQIPDMIE